MNNKLTDAAMAVLQDFWCQVLDLQEHDAMTPRTAREYWHSAANMCTAYSEQHAMADMNDEAAAFAWLAEIAIVHGSHAIGCTDKPKLQIVQSIGRALE